MSKPLRKAGRRKGGIAGNLFRGGQGNPAVNIQRDCYAMAMVNGDEAEITMYGVIVRKRPVDWWTGEEIKGEFIVVDEFLEDLKAVAGAKKITFRIDSPGGDTFATIRIHNTLRELKAYKTAIVEATAMSGMSVIICAMDKTLVYATDIIMVHKCAAGLCGYFNEDELTIYVEECKTTDKALVAAYKRKTGLDEETILSMMADVTYMTGEEAIEKGFADELLDDENAPAIAASADRQTLYVNGRAIPVLASLSRLPESIPTIQPTVQPAQAVDTNKQPAPTGGNEGGITMARTLKDLRAENPDLADELLAEAKTAVSADAGTATEAERKRIEEIDAVADLFDDETVQAAKYGENACTAKEMTYRAAQNAAKKGCQFLVSMKEDTQASGAEDVGAAASPSEEEKPLSNDQLRAQGRTDVKKMREKEEE